ncbi:hypothetical protein ALC53_06564 [Atta colombica]|uniref:Uncharacterized protein n=1 Tax=Atta colombica TaxID=520822 RepID=A0A151I3E1_9HYME|nr:hypothetical protein ALC53_06564 [Atta colombica]
MCLPQWIQALAAASVSAVMRVNQQPAVRLKRLTETVGGMDRRRTTTTGWQLTFPFRAILSPAQAANGTRTEGRTSTILMNRSPSYAVVSAGLSTMKNTTTSTTARKIVAKKSASKTTTTTTMITTASRSDEAVMRKPPIGE